MVVIGDAAGRILESDLVTDLSPPRASKDTSWIKPGRAAWSWWSESDSPKHAARLNAFTDLAAEMGWEYALVDANWNVMETGTIDDVVKHAREKKVGLLLWYNSGGPHNDVTEAPRDRMHRARSAAPSSRSCASGASRASRSTSGTATSRIASSSTATSCRTPPTFN